MQDRIKQALLSVIFLCVIGVTGCGLKRALYLPETPEENEPSKTTTEQAATNLKREQN
jgi:predicted small lipoprotein YifL